MRALFASVILAALGACHQTPEYSQGEATTASDPVAECVDKGIAYFKEIGSYPTLTAPGNKGRRADDVALERCQRSTMAFGD